MFTINQLLIIFASAVLVFSASAAYIGYEAGRARGFKLYSRNVQSYSAHALRLEAALKANKEIIARYDMYTILGLPKSTQDSAVFNQLFEEASAAEITWVDALASWTYYASQPKPFDQDLV